MTQQDLSNTGSMLFSIWLLRLALKCLYPGLSQTRKETKREGRIEKPGVRPEYLEKTDGTASKVCIKLAVNNDIRKEGNMH